MLTIPIKTAKEILGDDRPDWECLHHTEEIFTVNLDKGESYNSVVIKEEATGKMYKMYYNMVADGFYGDSFEQANHPEINLLEVKLQKIEIWDWIKVKKGKEDEND